MFSNLGTIKEIINDTQIKIKDYKGDILIVTATPEFTFELIQQNEANNEMYIKFNKEKLTVIEDFEED